MRRPDNLTGSSVTVTAENCPFCPGHEGMTPTEIYEVRDEGAQGWQVRVIPNLYKAVQIELDDHSRIEGMFESQPGVGAHEIVIDTPCHECRFIDLDAAQIGRWLTALASRVSDLRKDHRLIHVTIFKNHGEGAGATQPHPHTQIIALPIMPHRELTLLGRDLQYYRRHGRGKVEDLLENERRVEERMVSEQGGFAAFCPHASSYPFEVMIAPKRSLTVLDELNRDDIADLATLIRDVFERLDKELGTFDYNLAFRMAPLNVNFENEPYFPYIKNYYRMTLRIMPRIYRLGGFELATGMLINPVAPEEAAKLLREAKLQS
jgi:UDPglucose--hexose-1-phosphate uridylyltransferase